MAPPAVEPSMLCHRLNGIVSTRIRAAHRAAMASIVRSRDRCRSIIDKQAKLSQAAEKFVHVGRHAAGVSVEFLR